MTMAFTFTFGSRFEVDDEDRMTFDFNSHEQRVFAYSLLCLMPLMYGISTCMMSSLKGVNEKTYSCWAALTQIPFMFYIMVMKQETIDVF